MDGEGRGGAICSIFDGRAQGSDRIGRQSWPCCIMNVDEFGARRCCIQARSHGCRACRTAQRKPHHVGAKRRFGLCFRAGSNDDNDVFYAGSFECRHAPSQNRAAEQWPVLLCAVAASPLTAAGGHDEGR